MRMNGYFAGLPRNANETSSGEDCLEHDANIAATFESPEQWQALPRETRQEVIRTLFATKGDDIIDALLALIKAPDSLGVYASVGPNYRYAIFGRDSLEVAEDLIDVRPALSREIILAIASMSGRFKDSSSEEEKGKIVHEYRARRFGGTAISHSAGQILDELSMAWGGTSDELRYYGSVDATPLFVRTVARYCESHDKELLDELVTDRYGVESSLRDNVRSAVEWVVGKVENSSWSLLEFQRLNPLGQPNQSWKDSKTSYLHYDGTPANADGGIASIEVQGLAYDALLAGAELVALDESEERYWRKLARTVQQQTIDHLWSDEDQFFVIGLDRSPEDGTSRQIRTITSNVAATLDSGIFLDLPDEQRLRYVEAIVERTMGEDFLTSAGIRCRSLSDERRLKKGADYHGALVTWPKETYDIIKGLKRHGYVEQAQLLQSKLRTTFETSGEFREFYYVKPDGDVKHYYRTEHPNEPQFYEDGAVDTPEPCQAWSLSAAVAIAHQSNGDL